MCKLDSAGLSQLVFVGEATRFSQGKYSFSEVLKDAKCKVHTAWLVKTDSSKKVTVLVLCVCLFCFFLRNLLS